MSTNRIDILLKIGHRSEFMRYWWCNQNTGWAVERPEGVVCSSGETTSLTYRQTVGEARAGDIVVHYRKPNVVAFSRALEDGAHHDELPLLDGYSYGSGWRFKTEYRDLLHPINRSAFADELSLLSKKHYAINPDGKTKQGYFLQFDAAGLRVVLKRLREPAPQWLLAALESAPEAPDLSPVAGTFIEGGSAQVIINRYQRDPRAREACLRHHGANCRCCPIDLVSIYGSAWHKLIQVHHIIPLSELGPDYEINPATDLCPVCPNCHAFLHTKHPPYTPDEARVILAERAGKHRPHA